MLPSERQLQAQRDKVQLANRAARESRHRLGSTVRKLATTPAGLAAGFLLGMGAGWLVDSRRKNYEKNGNHVSTAAFLLPLFQLINSQLKGGS